MELVYALILAFIQGITEWFPVSSSGHLSLVEILLGLNRGLELQVALHFGTLMAVFVYFRKDIVNIIRDVFNGQWKSSNARLGFMLLVASIPAALMGILFEIVFDSFSKSFLVLGFGWLVSSVVLFIGSFTNKKTRKNISYLRALGVGISQMLSIIPGVSRSGMTISSGLFFGMDEKQAIRFSYLLSIPIIIGANLFTFGNRAIPVEYLFPTLICFALGLLVMNFSFRYVLNDRRNLRWFGVYTLILGIFSIVFGLI